MNKTEKKGLLEEYKLKYSSYDSFAKELHNMLEKIMHINAVHVAHIESRAKTFKSLKEKLERKGKKYKPELSEITDLAGIRIVVYSLDDIDIVEKIIRNEFSVDETHSVDKAKELKTNEFGYLSKHYIVSLNNEREQLTEYSMYVGLKAEIQVRTTLQHAWASIEHKLRYKSDIILPEEERRELSSIAAGFETYDKAFKRILDKYNELSEKELTEKS